MFAATSIRNCVFNFISTKLDPQRRILFHSFDGISSEMQMQMSLKLGSGGRSRAWWSQISSRGFAILSSRPLVSSILSLISVLLAYCVIRGLLVIWCITCDDLDSKHLLSHTYDLQCDWNSLTITEAMPPHLRVIDNSGTYQICAFPLLRECCFPASCHPFAIYGIADWITYWNSKAVLHVSNAKK